MYLFEGAAISYLPQAVKQAAAQGLKVGVLCSTELAVQFAAAENNIAVSCWGNDVAALAERLYALLRAFDKQQVDVILAEGVDEAGLGLAVMNRLRKAAGYQIVTVAAGQLRAKSGTLLPGFMLK